MAKARRKSAKKRPARKAKAKRSKMTAQRATTRAKVKAPPTRKPLKAQNLTEGVSNAIRAVVDTVKDTTRLRRAMPAQQPEE